MGSGKNIINSLMGSPWFHGNRAGGVLPKFDEFGRAYISRDLGTAANYGKPYGFLVDPEIPVLDLGDGQAVKDITKELFRDHYSGAAHVPPDLSDTVLRAIDEEGGNPRRGLERMSQEIASPDLNTESIWDDPGFARWFGDKFSERYAGVVDGNGVNAIISDPSFLNRGSGTLKSAGLMTAGAGAAAYGMSPDDAEASTATNLEKALVRDAEASVKPKTWAKDAGSNTPNVAQAVAPSDPFTPSPSQLASTAALVAALKSKDAPLEDTYQPADLLTAFATGGGGFVPRAIQAGLDPIFSAGVEYLPRVADAINPRNIVMGLMR